MRCGGIERTRRRDVDGRRRGVANHSGEAAGEKRQPPGGRVGLVEHRFGSGARSRRVGGQRRAVARSTALRRGTDSALVGNPPARTGLVLAPHDGASLRRRRLPRGRTRRALTARVPRSLDAPTGCTRGSRGERDVRASPRRVGSPSRSGCLCGTRQRRAREQQREDGEESRRASHATSVGLEASKPRAGEGPRGDLPTPTIRASQTGTPAACAGTLRRADLTPGDRVLGEP